MPNYYPKTDHLIPTQWQKGQSGNPSGKRKGMHRSTRFRKYLSVKCKPVKTTTGNIEDMSIIEEMDWMLIKRALQGDMHAIREVYNITEGRPKPGKRIEPFQNNEPIIQSSDD